MGKKADRLLRDVVATCNAILAQATADKTMYEEEYAGRQDALNELVSRLRDAGWPIRALKSTQEHELDRLLHTVSLFPEKDSVDG